MMNNIVEIDGIKYKFEITGTADVTPGPIRQIIIDEIVSGNRGVPLV